MGGVAAQEQLPATGFEEYRPPRGAQEPTAAEQHEPETCRKRRRTDHEEVGRSHEHSKKSKHKEHKRSKEHKAKKSKEHKEKKSKEHKEHKQHKSMEHKHAR
jgi:hypothetical protein